MSYRHSGKRRAPQKAWKAEECIYCPLKKPIAWPIVFLLFAFSPFIFANPTLNKTSSHSPDNAQPVLQPPPSQDINSILPEKPVRFPVYASPGK